jgi:hypothetical protein
VSRERWEYATVAWTDKTKRITKADPEYHQLPAKVQAQWEELGWNHYGWREQTYFIWFPGATKADERQAWRAGEDEYKVKFVDVMNELGADGWEAVTHVVQASAVGPNLGHDPAGYPIRAQVLLKRRTD